MKKFISLLLAMLLLCGIALAESVPSLSDSLYAQAKEALSRLSYGEYSQISGQLSYAGAAPSAEDWESLACSFSTLDNGTVQREVSVAYWSGGAWRVAVPVSEPKSEQAEALVLVSEDGQRFCGYSYARWGDVQSACEASDHVAWNKEYVAGALVIESDD